MIGIGITTSKIFKYNYMRNIQIINSHQILREFYNNDLFLNPFETEYYFNTSNYVKNAFFIKIKDSGIFMDFEIPHTTYVTPYAFNRNVYFKKISINEFNHPYFKNDRSLHFFKAHKY